MKTLAAAALIFWLGVQVFAVPMTQLDDAMNECSQKTGVDKKMLQMALQGSVDPTADPKLMAGMQCLLMKMEIIKVDKNQLKQLMKMMKPGMSDQQIQQMVDMCANQPATTPQEMIMNLMQCMQ